VQPPVYVNRTKTFNATTPRVVLTWHPSEQATLYASYAEGFRSGMHQVPTVVPLLATPEVDPDSLKNYEVGFKATLLDGRMSLDSAIYFIDWQDVQRQVDLPGPNDITFTGVVNGNSVSGMGVDLGIVAQAADGLELGLNASWNDLTTDSAVPSFGQPLFDEGDRLDYSPEITAGASLDYTFGVGNAGFEGGFSASGNYISQQSARALIMGRRVVRTAEESIIARASIFVRAPRNWTASVYVDNLTNEDASPTVYAVDPTKDIQLRPRTIGLQLQYSY
jgi:iron complex outermembrane recepter protein